MKKSLLVMLFLFAALSGPLFAEATEDADAIRQAVLDYANSAYDVRPDLVESAVHPKLQKIGYVSRDGASYRELWMNFYELQELVAGWNKEGRFDTATAKREVRILDQLDQTAVARLDAEWGIDFFHLAKKDGGWKIMNVIWQTYPPVESAEGGCQDNDSCTEDQFCKKDEGACEGTGSCEMRPEICTMDYKPVCGCDGETYGNACGAASAGVSVAKDGECS